MKKGHTPLVLSLLLAVATLANAQIYTIGAATDTFSPSFRDNDLDGIADEANTTYFGWASGTFDGGLNDELIDSPAPSLGIDGLNGTLNQVGTADILAGSNNIFIGADGRTETLSLGIPTNGTPGADGFTTIIIQGLTLTGSPAANTIVNQPVFGAIDGILPTFVIGPNANVPGQGQWWAKYELPGNQSVYPLSISLANAGGQAVPLTIAKLEVDTVYSSTGFAPDTAQAIPEPATWCLFLAAVGILAWLRSNRMPLVNFAGSNQQ